MKICNDKYKIYYGPSDITVWTDERIRRRKVSKWHWLWRQILCVAGISKNPCVSVMIEGVAIEVEGFIGDDGDFQIRYISRRD